MCLERLISRIQEIYAKISRITYCVSALDIILQYSCLGKVYEFFSKPASSNISSNDHVDYMNKYLFLKTILVSI